MFHRKITQTIKQNKWIVRTVIKSAHTHKISSKKIHNFRHSQAVEIKKKEKKNSPTTELLSAPKAQMHLHGGSLGTENLQNDH